MKTRLTSLALCLLLFPVILFAQSSGGINRADQQAKPYVILISLDGFRADYFERFEAPNFHRLMQQGVRAEGLIPVFPSKTFPNHYSIVTGMYADHHGLVSNGFYDPQRQQTYAMSDRAAVQDGSWYGGEPIWVTAEKQGMVAASFFWPGSEAAIGGVRPTYTKEYDSDVPNEVRVDTVLDWLKMEPEKRPHFITLYFSDVDSAGHHFGPRAPEVQAAIATVDHQLGRLLDGIESLPMREPVYVIVVSDHGMAETGPEQYIALDSLIDMEGVRIADAGTNANLHITGGSKQARAVRDAINRKLQHGRAYLRREIPATLHYRSNPRIGDIVIVMEEPYQIGSKDRAPRGLGGAHGWNPTVASMHGIFLVMGPGMKRGATIPRFENIQVYSLMAELLGLKAYGKIDSRPGWLRKLTMQNWSMRSAAHTPAR